MILLLTVGSVGCSDNPQKAIKPFNIVGFWAVNGGHQFENGSTIYFRKDGIFFCVASIISYWIVYCLELNLLHLKEHGIFKRKK